MAKSKSKAKIKDAVTKKQQTELVKLARAANRRLERAGQGQRASLNYNISQYTTINKTRGIVFSQAKAKTKAEYKQRMKELKKFMAAKTSKKEGWKKLEKSNIEKSREKLGLMGYDVTDEELKVVLEEIGGSSKEFYKTLENVSAKKIKKRKKAAQEAKKKKETPPDPDTINLTKDEVIAAINERRTDYQATLEVIKAREQ